MHKRTRLARNVSTRGHKAIKRRTAATGIAIGTAIALEGLSAVYGFSGIVGYDIFRHDTIIPSNNDVAIMLLILGTALASIATLAVLGRAVAHLSKRAVTLSHWVWAPMALNALYLLIQYTGTRYAYRSNLTLIFGVYILALLVSGLSVLAVSNKNTLKLQGVLFWRDADDAQQ